MCKGFDSCVNCSDEGHIHETEDDDGSPGNPEPDPEEKQLRLQICLEYLVHASQCRDANCKIPSCHRAKKLIWHNQVCAKENSECQICKPFNQLCYYHAMECQEPECEVPSCSDINGRFEYDIYQ